ncbi:MAG: EAL domain-containing protein [Clostridia bacterium]|nr:EAL domain-containing protein [Clostridia bacterium]
MINSKLIKKPYRVLIVDDQETNRDMLGMILKEQFEVIYASDGVEALKRIGENADTLSIVLLDIYMPNKTGFEVMEYMKEDEQLRNIPIIVLTSEKSAELKALQLGASDFITKPFDTPEVIIARIKRIIELCDGRKLISTAEHDPLTKLYSRNFFYEYAIRLYTYHPELHMDAVAIDIEQFHSLNALHGREFGDKILRLLSDEIRKFLKETEGIASRLEADRFEIYCLRQKDYKALLDRLQKGVNSSLPNVNIRMRMGVKEWSEDIEPLLMFDYAKAACNMARGSYQRPVIVFDELMQKREVYNQRLLNDMRTAIEEGQFTVFYQPKYDIQGERPRLCSAEALVRWQHPELGMIAPGDFIPLFEEKGLIGIVDSFVWRESAKQIAEWKRKYGITIPVSVNVSRADAVDTSLVDKLTELIKSNGFAFKDMKLEITESAYTDGTAQLINIVKSLRNVGFEIEMDDFGSGYSSLNMLSSMPIDVLKMDMKFIRNIEHNETDRRLVTLIIDLAKHLGVPVVAEGVETDKQLEILKAEGCDLVQGYYFSPPVPPEEFEKLIQKEIEEGKAK